MLSEWSVFQGFLLCRMWAEEWYELKNTLRQSKNVSWMTRRRKKQNKEWPGVWLSTSQLSIHSILFSLLTLLFTFSVSFQFDHKLWAKVQNARSLKGRAVYKNSERAQCIFWEHFRMWSLIVGICFPEKWITARVRLVCCCWNDPLLMLKVNFGHRWLPTTGPLTCL